MVIRLVRIQAASPRLDQLSGVNSIDILSPVALPAGRWPFARHHSTVIGLTADVPALAAA